MAIRPKGAPAPAAIEIEIGELVLHGFAPGDRTRIGDAVEAELQDLLARHSLPAEAVSRARVDAGKFQVARGAKPRSVGSQIAGALYRSVSGKRAG